MGGSQGPGRDLEVHVWTLTLDELEPGPVACLSPGELGRAERIPAGPERRRFITTRVAVRQLLAGYTAAEPETLRIEQRVSGKPHVSGGPPFSLTHSGPIALVAVATTEVGIDVERIRTPGSRRVLHRIFHPETVVALDATTADAFPLVFTRAWTQREAHVKAEGGGLFRTADVLPFEPVAGEHVLRRAAARDGSKWSVAHWTEQEGMIAAVVAAGAARRVRHLHWSPGTLIPPLHWR